MYIFFFFLENGKIKIRLRGEGLQKDYKSNPLQAEGQQRIQELYPETQPQTPKQ